MDAGRRVVRRQQHALCVREHVPFRRLPFRLQRGEYSCESHEILATAAARDAARVSVPAGRIAARPRPQRGDFVPAASTRHHGRCEGAASKPRMKSYGSLTHPAAWYHRRGSSRADRRATAPPSPRGAAPRRPGARGRPLADVPRADRCIERFRSPFRSLVAPRPASTPWLGTTWALVRFYSGYGASAGPLWAGRGRRWKKVKSDENSTMSEKSRFGIKWCKWRPEFLASTHFSWQVQGLSSLESCLFCVSFFDHTVQP